MIFWSSWQAPATSRIAVAARRPWTRAQSAPASSSATARESLNGTGRREAPRFRQLATGSLTVNVEPRRPSETTQMRPRMRSIELAGDVEAEPGPADTAREVRVETEELLEDP